MSTTGKFPAFHIEACGQKSRQHEVAPAAPDFVEWVLAETPESLRRGKVFPIVDQKTGKNLGETQIGKMIRTIGRKAGVVVATVERVVVKDGKRTIQPYKACAGSHDLRRSFCGRWAKKVMPAVLQRLARHENITTTMKYYVQLEADDIGADLWANHWAENGKESPLGNTNGNTGLKTDSGKDNENCHKSLLDNEKG